MLAINDNGEALGHCITWPTCERVAWQWVFGTRPPLRDTATMFRISAAQLEAYWAIRGDVYFHYPEGKLRAIGLPGRILCLTLGRARQYAAAQGRAYDQCTPTDGEAAMLDIIEAFGQVGSMALTHSRPPARLQWASGVGRAPTTPPPRQKAIEGTLNAKAEAPRAGGAPPPMQGIS